MIIKIIKPMIPKAISRTVVESNSANFSSKINESFRIKNANRKYAKFKKNLRNSRLKISILLGGVFMMTYYAHDILNDDKDIILDNNTMLVLDDVIETCEYTLVVVDELIANINYLTYLTKNKCY